MMIFLLQSFYFLSKLSRTKETDPREAGDTAYAITTSQKKNREPKHPVTWETRGWLPRVKENFASLRNGQNQVSCQWSSGFYLVDLKGIIFFCQDEHLKQISISKAIFHLYRSCRKLIAMQIILVHDDGNEFYPGRDIVISTQ